MKTSILLFTLSLAIATANAQNKYFEIYTDSTELKNQNDLLIQNIEAQIKTIEPSFSFKGLTTEIPNTFMPGQFWAQTNKIYHTTWQICGPPMEGILLEVAGSKSEGEKLAGMFFYGFFLPHEIGHALQFHTGNVPKSSYDGEYEANEFAVAYWRSKGKEKELQQCYEFAKMALSKLKNPIPENVDAKNYITEHYLDLVKDPSKYGYIQFSQIVEIMDNKSLSDFETYIKKYFKP